ncbi:MAG TPA: M48 family metallopeptidase [Nitrososphaerales archaeon]|nr:M48 family metallopeptidase [Nitrososphaerales archaeon]
MAMKASSGIDYVIVHELVHLDEKKHSERFFSLMGSAMPHWKQYVAQELPKASKPGPSLQKIAAK